MRAAKAQTGLRCSLCCLTRAISASAHKEGTEMKRQAKIEAFTVLPAKSDSDIMFCLQS